MSKFKYRSFKKILTDLQGMDFSFVQDADLGADAAYEMFEFQISQVVNRHAPIKHAYQRKRNSHI